MKLLIVGGDELVYHLSRRLISKGFDLTIINKDQNYCQELARNLNATIVFGDATDPEVLEDANIREVDMLAALTHKDQDNLIICRLAQKYYQISRTAALVNDPDNQVIFNNLNIDSLFNITGLLGSLLEQSISHEEVSNLFMIEEANLSVTKCLIPEGAPADGKTLKELDLPLSIILGGILREGEMLIPRGGTRIKAGDKAIIISLPSDQGEAIKALRGED
ncbi:MAG: potassium channel family protein [Halanaerobiaceae bacterium]